MIGGWSAVMDRTVISWISIVVLNVGVIFLLRVTMSNIDVRSVLREKNPRSQPSGTRPTAHDAAPAAGDAVGVTSDPSMDNTSYSRLSGFIGSIILACFLWAIGNILIYLAVNDMESATKFMSAMSTYFLAGASLFAPYAVNQLSAIFRPN
jgi:hypothetical protein